MELIQICEEGKHWYGFDGDNLMKECHYCKTKMHLQEDTIKWEERFGKKLRAGITKGLSRGKIIDSLPRLPWFSDAMNDGLNDPNQEKAHETWTIEDAKELSNLFAKYGISTHTTWHGVAEGIGRSLYAVERQLRIIIANKECDLDSLFPEQTISSQRKEVKKNAVVR